MKPSLSPPLPFDVPPRRKNGTGLTPESEEIYAAVKYLRGFGLRVYRAGDTHHSVNGERMGSAKLCEYAKFLKETMP